MSNDKALLDKADALMRRHRVFVAHGAVPPPAPGDMPPANPAPESASPAPAPAPVDTASPPDARTVAPVEARIDEPTAPVADDDIPLLTDIVPPETLADAIAPSITRQEVADAIQRWLDEALPATVLQVMDGMTDRLVAALTERARAELIEQLARPPRDDA